MIEGVTVVVAVSRSSESDTVGIENAVIVELPSISLILQFKVNQTIKKHLSNRLRCEIIFICHPN